MNNLLIKNKYGYIISAKCPCLDSIDRGCNTKYKLPHCYDCAYISKDDIRQIFNKLYKYGQTGLMFKDIEEKNKYE